MKDQAATAGPGPAEPMLRLAGITKRFAGVTALEDVSFELRRGEAHALVGENGAGKSTLIKILTGAYRPDGGSIVLEGREVHFRSPAEAQAAGVVAVHQEVRLLSYRSVAENLFFGREPRRWGLIDWRRMEREAAALLARLELDIDPRAVLGRLPLAEQQLVAIARGVSFGARVLVLDEPTSALADREVALLFDVVGRLRAQGTGVVYISHRFDELYTLCDTVTVLRDGRHVGTRPLAGLERVDLVRMMLGRERQERHAAPGTDSAPEDVVPGAEAPLLEALGLRAGARLRGVSLSVRRGEVVGLAGLLGSGRTETARAVFGAAPPDSGELRVSGAACRLRSPAEAIRAGLAFLPEDRKAEGIIPELSVRENLTLAALPALSRLGIVSRGREREVVDRFMTRLGIKASSAEQRIRELSGGNQQKVLLARWLCTHPRLLILDEPTRGIDIGAKAEIQALIAELTGTGLGILLISSEVEELVESSDRVVVLRDGASVAELGASQVTQDGIFEAMAGQTPAPAAREVHR